MGVLDFTGPDFNNLSVKQLYQAVLGYRAFPYFPRPDAGFPEKDRFGVTTIDRQNVPDVYPDATLPATSSKRAAGNSVFGNAYFMPVSFVNVGSKKAIINLPNEPIITARLTKHIVKTAVAGSGSKSSVKELTGFEDVKISIEGIAINETNTEQWPEAELSDLRTLYEQRTSLNIRCALLKSLGISKVAIEELDIKPIAGHQGSFQYSMSLVSDEDYAYILLGR